MLAIIITAVLTAIAAAGATFFILKRQAATADAAGDTTITETDMATIKQRLTTTEAALAAQGQAIAAQGQAIADLTAKLAQHTDPDTTNFATSASVDALGERVSAVEAEIGTDEPAAAAV